MASGILNIDSEKIFKIKPSEVRLVRLLFLHNFFQGFGLALFFTAANAIFLSSYNVSKLPLVYILSGIVLFIAGSVYSYFEERTPHKVLLQVVVILVFIIVFVVWLGVYAVKATWIAFFIIILYRVVDLLGNLEFWGLSSLLLNVRQSKRLFGLISSGEVTAKLIGYLSVPFIVRNVGNNNLIIIAAFSFLICLYFFNRVIKLQTKTSAGTKDQTQDRKLIDEHENILKKYFKSDFIVLLSILSFLSILAFTFIDFSFMTNVQNAYPTREQIAVFFGLFYGFAKGVTFIVKFFLSGRLIDLLGVKRSLMLLPILFLLIIATIIVFNLTSQDKQYFIFLFGFLMLTNEILRFSLHEPVFFSLFQPLNQKLRLFGQAVVNGLLNPVALGIAGLFLFLLIQYNQAIDLNLVTYLLLLILVGWIIIVVLANRQYIIVLQNAVKKRYFEGSEIALKGKVILNILKSKLESIYPEEIIYSTELILKLDPNSTESIFKKLLAHSHEEVQLYVIKKIEELKLKNLMNEINEIIFSDFPDNVKQAAIKTYCILDENAVEKILSLLESNNKAIRLGATTGLLKSGGLEAVVMAGQKLLELIESEETEDKITAAQIMSELSIKNFYQPVIRFFNHENPDVKLAAIEASGFIRNEKFIPYLIYFLNEPHFQEKAVKNLVKFGDTALDAIQEQLNNAEKKFLSKQLAYRFCQICGSIGGEKAHQILLQFLEYPVAFIRYEALSSLKKSQFKAISNEQDIKSKFDKQFLDAVWLIMATHSLTQKTEQYADIIRALELEMEAVKENLFITLSFLYDTRTIFKAKEGIATGIGEKSANALEIIDNLISKRFSAKLSLILEDMTLEERVKKLASYPPGVNIDPYGIIKFILSKKENNFNRWTQVCAINALKKISVNENDFELLNGFLTSKDKILVETTVHVINHFLSGNSISRTKIEEKINLKKLKFVMETIENSPSILLDIEKVIILKSTSLFSETPENILVDVANIIQEERVEEGTTIFKKGDMGYCMYIINEGEIRIHDHSLTFAILKNRDFFGELALLDPEPRSASATTIKDSLLLRLDQDAFYELMAERMEVAKGILKILCRRIREQNDRISKLKAGKA